MDSFVLGSRTPHTGGFVNAARRKPQYCCGGVRATAIPGDLAAVKKTAGSQRERDWPILKIVEQWPVLIQELREKKIAMGETELACLRNEVEPRKSPATGVASRGLGSYRPFFIIRVFSGERLPATRILFVTRPSR